MKKALIKAIIGGGLILAATQALGSKTYSYTTIDEAVFAQEDHSQAEYTKAMMSTSIDEKIRLFEQFVVKYPNSQFDKYAYKEITLGYYANKNYDKVIINSDKALSFNDLDDESRAQLLLVTAESYIVSPDKKDLAKATNYLQQAKRVIGSAQLSKAYLDAASKLERIINNASQPKAPAVSPVDSAKNLYAQKNYSAAADAFSKLDQNDPKVDYYYGLSLAQLKQFDKAIPHLLEASIASSEYSKAKDLAYNAFLGNVYKDPKSGRGYNSLLTESTNRLNQEINRINKEWNDKYAKEFTDEEWAKIEPESKRERAAADARIAQLKKDADAYGVNLKKDADTAFEKLVTDAKKRIGK
ncbi:hypothetical protein JW756_04020 [Candidatus Woesearchaeota archaeon]|nr:hypothetical protein [Candidatus Woesearchaeota archaeon]